MQSYTLKTERLLLRPIEKEDAKMLWPFVSDPLISNNMSWQAHQQLSETQEFIDTTLINMESGKTITWCIFFENTFCGIFSLISIIKTHRALVYNRAELAYWISTEFQGKGIMTEAGKRIIAFAFENLKLNKLVVGHHITNDSSKKLILRLGFHFLYTEEEVFMKNGEWITCQFYELKLKDYLHNRLI
jgi:ribosomal-protein-alanine N-acetyltransferase